MLKVNSKTLEDSFKKLKRLSDNKSNFVNASNVEFISFKTKRFANKLAVIDGSNNVINGVGFDVVLMRAGALIFQDGNRLKELDSVDDIDVFVLLRDKNSQGGYISIYNSLFLEIVGEIAPQNIEFDKVQDKMRTLLEWKKISDLLEILEAGDVIVFDGSLVSGSMNTSEKYFENILNRARKKQIYLVGLTKDTNLTHDGVPIPSLLRNAAKRQGIDKNWYVEWELDEEICTLDKTYFVKFTKAREFVFRFDVVVSEGQCVEDVIKAVASYSFAETSLGYPYPLNEIHEAVLISKTNKEEVFHDLKMKWIKEMKNEKEFEELFYNFHKEQLDISTLGR